MTDVDRAMLLAKTAHGNQMYGKYPYLYHLLAVTDLASEFNLGPEVETACMLHDILEDTSLSYNDIKNEFGEEVADIVYAVTDELGKNRHERHVRTYPKIRENWKAEAVKVCDRLANLIESNRINSRFVNMYIKEHEEFKLGIRNPEHKQEELVNVWNYLDTLIELYKNRS